MAAWRNSLVLSSLLAGACSALVPASREPPGKVESPVTEYETDAGKRIEQPHHAPPPEYGNRIVLRRSDAGSSAE